MSELFFLMEKSTKKKFERLTLAEVIETLRSCSSDELDGWYYWQKGMEKWQRVSSSKKLLAYLQSSSHLHADLPTLPPIAADLPPLPTIPKSLPPPPSNSTDLPSLPSLPILNSVEKLPPVPVVPENSGPDIVHKVRLELVENIETEVLDERTEEIKTKSLDETTEEIKTKNLDETTEEIKTKNLDETTEEIKAPHLDPSTKGAEISPPPLPPRQRVERMGKLHDTNPILEMSQLEQVEYNGNLESRDGINHAAEKTEILHDHKILGETTMNAKTQLIDSESDPTLLVVKKGAAEDPIDRLQQTRSIPPEFLSMGGDKDNTGGSFPKNRKTTRFDVNFRLMISNGEDSIISFSSNISLGGIKLAHELPEPFVGTNCEIFIMHNETRQSIKLACRVLGTVTDRSRIAFEEQDLDTLETLLKWISQGKESLTETDQASDEAEVTKTIKVS